MYSGTLPNHNRPVSTWALLLLVVGGGFSLPRANAFSLAVNGLNGEYTTSKFFLDERDTGDTVALSVQVDLSEVSGLDLRSVEVFTNLGRREFTDTDWNNDGHPDGIKFPNFNQVTTANAETGFVAAHGPSYYRPYPMVHDGGQVFSWSTTTRRCGAYRLSARYRKTTDPAGTWRWYLQHNETGTEIFPEAQQLARAHAIVISPRKTLDMTLYELNAMTVEATDNTEAGRSTFDDLLGAPIDNDGNDPFNLDYLDTLQANCLWFQPIHPSGEDSRTQAEGYQPGSPYATRNYFAVSRFLGHVGTEADALAEFQRFVTTCDTHPGSMGTINVMLDFVANHTSWDAVFGQGGADLFGLDPTRRIGWDRPYWYARNGNYCQPATWYNHENDNDFAVAPDRDNFGKWADVAELYFGSYAALVCQNPADNNNYLSEQDWIHFLGMGSGVVETWRYMAYYPEFWIKTTGHPGHNDNPLNDDLGVDAFRCDFAQGLPPQCWEYLINRTREVKWNTVFMAETLDGGVPGYRSNRHFDILNENLLFTFTQAHVNDSWEIYTALEARKSAYNGGAILLNLTSHDEILPDNDTWLNATRYGALSTVDGLPMVFYGQEQGSQNYNPDGCCWYYDGFKTDHELNFGKRVPHFKQWNQLLTWYPGTQPPNNGGLAQWYGRVNGARLASPALNGRKQYFLRRRAGGDNGRIFAVAKYQDSGVSPAQQEVVLAFALLFRHGESHAGASDTYDLSGPWSRLGMDPAKLYTVRNLASGTPGTLFTDGWPRTGQDVYDHGIYVRLGGGTIQPITDDGELVQYLQVVELDEDIPYDSDGDLLYDGWEQAHFQTLAYDADDNNDHDSMLNGAEQTAGTDPTLASSVFVTGQVGYQPDLDAFSVQVPVRAGRTYHIEFTDGPLSQPTPVWQPFAAPARGEFYAAGDGFYSFLDDFGPETSLAPPVDRSRTYRVLVKRGQP